MSVPASLIPGLVTGVPLQLPYVVYATSGAITLVAGGLAVLTIGSAGAYTLAAPTVNGGVLVIVAGSAQAHVVTSSVVGFNAKGSSGTLTFGGAIGDAVILVSYNGNWYTASKINVTVA
jgi:hypothetical protein